MKRVVLLLTLFCLMFVSAVNEPTVDDLGGGDMENIQDTIDDIPIDPETGEFDFNNTDIKTKADERIAKINEKVGPVTKVLFGVELTLSWIFVFSVLLWVLLIELIIMPVSEIFEFNIWLSLLASTIIATLAMQGIGKHFVVWIDALITQWYIAVTVIVVAVIAGIVYSAIMKYIGATVKNQNEAYAKKKVQRNRRLSDLGAKADAKKIDTLSS